MDKKTLHIKNMVCSRCIKVVKEELEKLNYKVEKVELGTAVIRSNSKQIEMKKISEVLHQNGFDLIDSRNANIIEKVKILIINKIHHTKYENLSDTDFHKEIMEKHC